MSHEDGINLYTESMLTVGPLVRLNTTYRGVGRLPTHGHMHDAYCGSITWIVMLINSPKQEYLGDLSTNYCSISGDRVTAPAYFHGYVDQNEITSFDKLTLMSYDHPIKAVKALRIEGD
ncbi:hypothetical protein VNO77_14501 [Canavalia gladiata]|uniref:Uncharacterized protein n=1 Tax=Canavalia gladiata TaxID=3824 RepID=A0AAN9LZF0_CANGL